MGPVLKRLLRLIPSYRMMEERKKQLIGENGELIRERDVLQGRLEVLETEHALLKEWVPFFAPGHYYSPLPPGRRFRRLLRGEISARRLPRWI